MEYFDQIRENTDCNYLDSNAIVKKAPDTGLSSKELCDLALKNHDNGENQKAIELLNLAVFKSDSFETRFARGSLFFNLSYYNEAEEDYQKALLYKNDDIECLNSYMYIEIMLQHIFVAIEIGEKLRKMRDHNPNWSINAYNLIYLYINNKEVDKAIVILRECEREKDKFHHDFIDDVWESINEMQENKC